MLHLQILQEERYLSKEFGDEYLNNSGGSIMVTKIVRFKNLCCANCAANIERKINKLKGVKATVSFVAGKILLELDNEDLLDDVLLCIKKEEPNIELKL